MKPWVSISSPSKLGVMSALPVLKRWRQEDLESKDSLSSVEWEASWGSMKPSLEKIEESHRPSEANPHCQQDLQSLWECTTDCFKKPTQPECVQHHHPMGQGLRKDKKEKVSRQYQHASLSAS